MKKAYPIVLTPFGDREGYSVSVPDIESIHTEGIDIADAILNAEEVIYAWITEAEKEGKEIPEPGSVPAAVYDNIVEKAYAVVDTDSDRRNFGK